MCYIAYSKATSIGEYNDLHPLAPLRAADLAYDLSRGYALVHKDDISPFVQLIREEVAPYVTAPRLARGQLPPRFQQHLHPQTRLLVTDTRTSTSAAKVDAREGVRH